jgi:hypothetical protein
LNATAYQDTNGFGWGTNDQAYKAFNITNIDGFSTMKIVITGAYNTPAGGLGMMTVGSASYQGYLWNQALPGSTALSFTDGNTDSAQLQGLSYTDSSGNHSETLGNVNNRSLTIVGASNLKWVNMTGYTSTYAYTKRYISLMMVR